MARSGEETQHRLIALAIERFGYDELARHLKTSRSAIESWINRQSHIPHKKMLAIIDLLDSLGALGDVPK